MIFLNPQGVWNYLTLYNIKIYNKNNYVEKKNAYSESNWNRSRVVNNVHLDVRNYIKGVNKIDYLLIQFDTNLISEVSNCSLFS